VNSQSQYRSQTLYTISTTPQQDAAIQSYLNGTADDIGLWDNCAARSYEALKAGGVLDNPTSARTPDGLEGQILLSHTPFTKEKVSEDSSVSTSVTGQFEVIFEP
jgi:hypothetical protein